MPKETKEEKEKRELIYFRERARSRRQLWQITKNLFLGLLHIGIVYLIFSWAMVGVKTIYGPLYENYTPLQVCLSGVSVLWLVFCVDFYKWYSPINDDAFIWINKFCKKLTAALKGWDSVGKKGEKP